MAFLGSFENLTEKLWYGVQLSQKRIQSYPTLWTLLNMDTSVLRTVRFCSWGKKPLTFSLNLTRLTQTSL